MYYSATGTATYTVVDIRKAFEGFESDLRMIARLTNTWTMEYVESVFHDVIKLAEAKYLAAVSVVLENSSGIPIQAAKFVPNPSGSGIASDRPGGNNWSPIPNTRLSAILEYTPAWHALNSGQQNDFEKNNDFCIPWIGTNTNTSFPGLRQSTGQLYASNGYELKKHNYN